MIMKMMNGLCNLGDDDANLIKWHALGMFINMQCQALAQ